MPSNASTVSMFTILWLVASSGGFGGMVHFLFSLGSFYRDDNQVAAHWKHGKHGLGAFLFAAALVIAVLVGIAGALAVLFVIIEAGKFPKSLDAENELFLITLSVVAGFGSRQILPSISETFRQQLNRLAGQHAELQAETAKAALRVSAISRANTALASPTTPPSELISAAQGLAALTLPSDRTVALLQGRLYRACADRGPAAQREARYGQAIAVLTGFLQAKGATRDIDYADALYNRACYKCLRNANQDLQQALDDLRESVGINADNKALAREDSDFDHLRQDPNLGPIFTQLLAA